MASSTLLYSLIFLFSFSCIVLSQIAYTTASATTTTTTTFPTTNFIRTSCKATTYPVVCIQSLTPYASTIQKSPRKIIAIALSVSLNRAKSTKAFVVKLNKFHGLKPKEYAALKDCKEQMGDSIDMLNKSLAELKLKGPARGPKFTWNVNNVQTWVSAALTDESTCMDGFSGRAMDGRVKSSIRARVTNLAQVTTNALSLCNHFAAKN